MSAHTSLTMVGRDDELDRLSGLVGLSSSAGRRWQGRPGAVLLSGDAGVGKTRLLIELRDRAKAQDWQVYAGHCLDFGESALPYLPFSEILGRIATEHPDLIDRVAAQRPSIARLQPGRRVRGEGEVRDADEAGADVGSAADRHGLFEAVHVLLETVAAEAPVLLVLEDAHWADQSTRDLIGFLFTRPFAQPVALVVSYRSDDLHRRHPLRRQVAEWSRTPSVDRLDLSPLPETAVRALVRELCADALGETAVAGIVDRAEGNAFFVEELVASNRAGERDDLPWVLADVLLDRLDRLSDEARQVVRVASVAGRRVTHELLAAASTMPPDQFEAGIRQAVEMNVLEAGARHYSFRHALLGEAVYDDLLPGERVRLHAHYVAALGDAAGRGTAAELARHARRANDLDRAVTAGIEAGDEAFEVGGPDEAADHYEQVLELLEDPARVQRLGVTPSKIVARASDALVSGGDMQRACQLLREHLDRTSPGDTHARCRLLSQYAELLTVTENDLDAAALSAEAVALAPDGESPLRAKVLIAHARVLANVGREDEAESFATEALALAERLAMPVLASEVVTTLSGLRVKTVVGSEQEALRRALEAAVRRAGDAGALQAELRGRFLLGRSYQDSAEWDLAVKWFGSAVEAGDRTSLPWAPYIIESRWQLTAISYLSGEWDRVLELTRAVADESGPPIPRGLLAPTRYAVLAGRGEEVLDELRGLRPLWEDEGSIGVFSAGVEMDVLGRRGDLDGALAAYDDVIDVLTRIWHDHFAGRVRLSAQVLGAVASGLPDATAGQRRALAARADQIFADGREVAERFRTGRSRWGPEGQMWEARLRAEHLRVHWLAGVDAPDRDELLLAWNEALEATTKFGHVPEQARVRSALAQILRLVGDPAAAREEADAALAIAERLRAPLLAGDSGHAAAVAAPVADRPAPSRTAARQQEPHRLTPREGEILALVAEGRTNGEIARQLFIATKTVSVHVSNILGKLDATSRTEAAAIARREGLLG